MATATETCGFDSVNNWQSGKSLAECNFHMLTSEDSCDVSFWVGKEKTLVRAHRYILISRSSVFHTMMCGPLAEKDEIKLPDVDVTLFKELLRFLYTNQIDPNPETVTGLLYLAKKYAVGGLEHLCLTYLESCLSTDNACVILQQTHLFDEKQLNEKALQFVLEHGDECLATDGFRQLGRECFIKVISSEVLAVQPERVFDAAVSWAEDECRRHEREITTSNLRSTLGQAFYAIPFPDMDQIQYVKNVLPRKLLTNDENVTIMAALMCSDNDPSPFKGRKNKSRQFVPSVAASKSADVIFCTSHTVYPLIWGGLDFRCYSDTTLLGIYVYGSEKCQSERYHVRVRKRDNQTWLENNEHYSIGETKFNDHHIKKLFLSRPLKIDASVHYFISVKLLGNESPAYVGDGSRSYKTVSQRTFQKENVTYTQAVNLIYGLIVQD